MSPLTHTYAPSHLIIAQPVRIFSTDFLVNRTTIITLPLPYNVQHEINVVAGGGGEGRGDAGVAKLHLHGYGETNERDVGLSLSNI